ncbi:hypothetical protein RCL1_000264 [Eukaryota sp. TZLM3-RCL]
MTSPDNSSAKKSSSPEHRCISPTGHQSDFLTAITSQLQLDFLIEGTVTIPSFAEQFRKLKSDRKRERSPYNKRDYKSRQRDCDIHFDRY